MKDRNNIVENCYERLPIGIITLDSKFSVIESNKEAQEYCRDIVDNAYTFKSDNEYKSSIYISSDSKYVQNVVNYWIGNSTVNNYNQSMTISTNSSVYDFFMSSFLISSHTGVISTIYFIYVTQQQKIENRSIVAEIASQFDLTKREFEIVNLIAKGYSNKEISDKLCISVHTVKTHILNIFKKTGVTSRTELVYKLSPMQSYEDKYKKTGPS